MVAEHLETVTCPEDYARAPGWLREAYPEMFSHPWISERLLLHALVFRAGELFDDPWRFDDLVLESLEWLQPLEQLLSQ